ncbi:hypothetical protein GDO81_021949 [Engystomops pustulosus]|uniref:Uncharacterized protein n=1 Tax=Engystomops pustulosus TaxID=76066 RepID=A0AAV6YST3_ENGPU|nr:hypothetical protein GDO81_021949 [Engystomops pustulosus]
MTSWYAPEHTTDIRGDAGAGALGAQEGECVRFFFLIDPCIRRGEIYLKNSAYTQVYSVYSHRVQRFSSYQKLEGAETLHPKVNKVPPLHATFEICGVLPLFGI